MAPALVLARALAGHLDVEHVDGGLRPWRLPARHRRYAPPALRLMAEFAAGVRLRLSTDADVVEIDLDLLRLVQRGQDAPAQPSVVVAELGGEAVATAAVESTGLVHELADGSFRRGEATRTRVALALGPCEAQREVVVWLPHDSAVVLHTVTGQREGRTTAVQAAAPGGRRRWLHHGSSISHGGTVWSPAATWPVLAARALNLDLTNLGFGGNAMLDPMTAAAIRDAEADVVSLELGINVVAADAMRERAFVPAVHGFLDRVRERHPATPVVVLTAFACPALEDHPGPIHRGQDGRVAVDDAVAANRLTLGDSRRLLREVVDDRRRDGEPTVLVEGTDLFGPADLDLLPDGLHPDERGHRVIAQRFASLGLPRVAGPGPDRAPRPLRT
ncbi:MAG: hypothetical protein KQH57_19315 [Actinomycetales bacterium]|nr:hypothetical protein [Actinomycetales bacterium]